MSTAASLPEFEASSGPTPLARPPRDADVERPEVLRGKATLTVHTRQAQRLVRGRTATADKPACQCRTNTPQKCRSKNPHLGALSGLATRLA